MQYRKMLVVASLASALLLGIQGVASAQAAGDDDDQYMMGPGYGMMGPGMMGPGMMGQGYGMGPGMMGPGYRMGPGMMYRGYGHGMGPGMMGYGYGMGPGMMYRGYGYGMRVTPTLNLTVDDVKNYFTGWLEMQGNKRLRVGKVAEKDKNTITADIETVDGSLVQQLDVDRHTGLFHPAEQ